MNKVSFGGGVNSSGMLLGMYEKGIPCDLILFADPGGEKPETYKHRDEFSEWLVAHGYPPITTSRCSTCKEADSLLSPEGSSR